MFSRTWIFSAAVLLQLYACAAGPPATPKPPPAPYVPGLADLSRVQALMAERSVSGEGANYRIAEGDELRVSVVGNEEFDRNVRVSDQGRITLPLIAPVYVQGLTVIEARAVVSRALEQYLQEPIVSLSVEKHMGATVAVVGEVGKPGDQPLEGFNQTIADVLTQAGGFTAKAGQTLFFFPAGAASTQTTASLVASVQQSPGGATALKQAAIEIDLTRLYRGSRVPELDLPVRPGDAILVPAAGDFFISGWVTRTGRFPLETRMTLTEAVAKAGGMNFGASRGWLKLVRSDPHGETVVHWVDYTTALGDTSQDPLLQSGDRIEVQAEPVRAAGWSFWNSVREIFYFRAGGSFGDMTR